MDVKIPSKIYQVPPQNTYLSIRIIYPDIRIIYPDAQAAPRPQQGFPGAICACCLRGGSRRHTEALGHHVHKDDTCWPDKQGLEKREKALGSDQLPTHRAADGQGENTSPSPLETAAGKSLCREEHGEQPLRHRDENRIWEYPCLGKREGKRQPWCPKGTIPYYLLFYSLESCRERGGRGTPSSPPSGSSLT